MDLRTRLSRRFPRLSMIFSVGTKDTLMLMLAKEVLESHRPFSGFLVPRCRVEGAELCGKVRAVVHIQQFLNAWNV